MSSAAAKTDDVILAEMKKAPEDIEAQAVSKIQKDVEKRIQSELCESINDHLADELLPPFDIIMKLLKKMVPKCIVAVKSRLDRCLSKSPCSGFLHLLLIEMMSVYIFYYSVQNVFTQVIVAVNKDMEKNKVWPAAAKVDKCLKEYANRLLWLREHMSPDNCFKNATVEPPYKASPDDSGSAWVMGAINYGCLLLCILLWIVVVGNFAWRNSCRIWVRYHSGMYLKCAFFTRRSYLYRYICGLIGLGAFLSIAATLFICARIGMLGWLIQNQLANMIVVIVSAKAFLTPTKPKFEYEELHQLSLKRPTFFQTNGTFATSFTNALIQSVRGEQFRTPLVNMLEKSEDWELALKLCMTRQGTTGQSGNKVLMALWSGGQAALPTILSSAREAASK